MRELKQLSRAFYNSNGENPAHTELQTGALQRIADATELMAKRYQDLIDDRDRYKQNYYSSLAEKDKLYRRIAALQGVITKLKKKKQ